MATKYQSYAVLAEQARREIMRDHESWKAFLRTSARLYKYPYADQLMIYAQRPDATACASYDLWNQTMHRYVKRNSKGIALLRTDGDNAYLAYVFDVSDTGTRRNSRQVNLFEMLPEYVRPIMEAMENRYGISGEKGLEEQILDIARTRASDYWDEHESEISDILEGSSLEEYDGFNLKHSFREACCISTAYALYTRLTGDPDGYFEDDDFKYVFDFNTRETSIVLGTAVSTLSEEMFREIETAVRAFDRTRTTERSGERRDRDGRNHIQPERGLSDSGYSDIGDGDRAAREIRTDEEGVSEREEADPVQRASSDRETVPAPSGDTGNGIEEGGTNHGGTSERESGTGQDGRPDGMGTAHEQPEITGGGDRDGGTYQQLTLDLFISEEEQIRQIDQDAERGTESAKPSVFLITDEDIDNCIKGGSGFHYGKFRISLLYEQNNSPDDRARYLKDEYGIGGRSISFHDGSRGFLNYDSKGISIDCYEHDIAKVLRWREVEKRLGLLIERNEYLSEQELREYEELKSSYTEYGGLPLPKASYGFTPLDEMRERWLLEHPDTETVKIEENTNDSASSTESEDIDDDSVSLSEEGTAGNVEPQPAVEDIVNEPESLTEDKATDNNAEPKPALEDVVNESELLTEDKATDNNPEPQSAIEDAVIEPESPAETINTVPPRNFRITDDHLGEGGPKEKFSRNIAAIRLLYTLESENRNATEDEQRILSQYVGWGGLADAFDPNKPAWSAEYAQLKELLPKREYEMARSSVLNAHYTSPVVIRAIYDAVGQMGFMSGNILEPSMGIGNFFGMLPEAMQGSRLYGIELDPISGRIAQKLYPNANITISGFEDTDNRDFYDLAIGNVPFGGYKVSDKPYDHLGFSIHNYFFAKAIDQVRPGGLVAFVTSKYTMDSQSSDVRRYIAQRAELIGAIRLPDNAFRANAGAEVVSDIIFLQKREHPIDIEPDWVQIGLSANNIRINSYFAEHPEMILGELKEESTPFGRMEGTVKPFEGADLGELLQEAVSHLHAQYVPMVQTIEDEEISANVIPADPNVKNFSYTVVDGDVYFRENSVMNLVELNDANKGRIKGLVQLRRIVNELIDYQLQDYPDEDILLKQTELNAAYDDFTAQFGLINAKANSKVFQEDSSYYLLCSLENLDENGNLLSKADMFTKRTIRPQRVVNSVDTPSEALAVSIGERGKVDLPYMADLLGEPGNYERITKDLTGVIFKDPVSGGEMTEGWQTADEYLSGNVREKLRIAKVAENTDNRYSVNVKALEQAQPVDLEASEIDIRLGAIWVPPHIFEQFMYETFETPYYNRRVIQLQFSPATAEWRISGKSVPSRYDVPAYSTYGTERANAYRILEDTLNLRDVRIFDTVEDADGKNRRVLNKKETTLAQQRQQSIKDAFQDWVWKNPDRREFLVARYNEIFNSTKPREYDGSHIHFGGMNPEVQLRPHQLGAIAHILYGGNTLLAHEVGAGKTYEMAASAMESKRLGLCQKSMFVVPNHLTLQWANEFLHLYPSAKILVASKRDFETKRRKKFCARIATGDYDAVIIGHSQFEKIPISAERQERLLREQIDEIEEAIGEAKFRRGENFTIKQMEKTRKSLEAKLEKLQANERKDDVITFEQLGVDRLFVDESQAYKNCFIYTKMRNVAGLATSEAQKSSDMLMKCQYMDEITGGRGIVFASGSPISNSMSELYSLMRYLQYHTLREKGLQHFDCWASTFGETTTAIELAPEGTGYRARTRFAKFFNLPELMNMFKEVADIKTGDMLNLPVPKAIFETVVVQPTEIQKEMVKSLSDRAAAVHANLVDPSVDNMLKITSDGRKIGLDQRLMNPLLPDEPGSKVNACVSNVFAIWEQGKKGKLTQLIFSDLSTPKNDGTFNVYDDIKGKLITKGVPESDIAFIHNADTEAKKKELFAKVRSGQVRILMGSTQKMGAGTNVQDRLYAVHHLDVGWRPADMTQRNGRIIRQGNTNPEVKVFQYVTEGTFDSYLYQMLENKQRFISQIMTSKAPVRSCEDVDEQVLSFAEVKALCAGNVLIKEKMDLDIEVARLKVLKADHRSKQFKLEDQLLKFFPAEIEKQKVRIDGLEHDLVTLQEHPVPKETFVGMRIGNNFYDKKEDAGQALLNACKSWEGKDNKEIGEYRGFGMELSFNLFYQQYEIVLHDRMRHRTTLGSDARGNITRLDNTLASIPDNLEKAKAKLSDLESQRDSAKEEIKKPFREEETLKQKSARLAELDALLNMEGPSVPPEEDISAGNESAIPGYVAEPSETKDNGARSSVLAELKGYGTLSRSSPSHPKPCVEVL